jgi:hypothetical protein
MFKKLFMTVVFVVHLIMTLVAKRSAKRREVKEKSIVRKPVENDELFDHLFINKTTKQLIKL